MALPQLHHTNSKLAFTNRHRFPLRHHRQHHTPFLLLPAVHHNRPITSPQDLAPDLFRRDDMEKILQSWRCPSNVVVVKHSKRTIPVCPVSTMKTTMVCKALGSDPIRRSRFSDGQDSNGLCSSLIFLCVHSIPLHLSISPAELLIYSLPFIKFPGRTLLPTHVVPRLGSGQCRASRKHGRTGHFHHCCLYGNRDLLSRLG